MTTYRLRRALTAMLIAAVVVAGLPVAADERAPLCNSDSFRPSISADGRYVAFESHADNLATEPWIDNNGRTDVYLADRHTGDIRLISLSSTGGSANGNSGYPVISADGRFITYWSEASDIVTQDTNAAADIFLHDREAGYTIRVSVSTIGRQADGRSWSPDISDDGSTITFHTAAALSPADDNDASDVYAVGLR